MLMDLYINGTGIISAAGFNSEAGFLNTPPDYNTDQLLCKEPDYTTYVPPMQLRRMSKAVRMGIAASKICLQQAGAEKPDAISVGTALGCLYDTEQFLAKMIAQDEQMLTPTAFIQSTHNTVAGQIALLTGCNGHNLTFVHKGHSFEHAMMDAQLYLQEHPDEKILVGGIDELTATSKEWMQQAGIYRKENATPQDILYGSQRGSIAGEGASFFLISKQKTAASNLHIKAMALFVSRDKKEALQKVNTFLQRERITPSAIDLVLLGINGDERNNGFYQPLMNDTFKETSQAAFKHLSGEYATASAFALGLLAASVKKNALPLFTILNKQPEKLKNILVINNFIHHYSCWYMEVI